jgi:hypothetical protein
VYADGLGNPDPSALASPAALEASKSSREGWDDGMPELSGLSSSEAAERPAAGAAREVFFGGSFKLPLRTRAGDGRLGAV